MTPKSFVSIVGLSTILCQSILMGQTQNDRLQRLESDVVRLANTIDQLTSQVNSMAERLNAMHRLSESGAAAGDQSRMPFAVRHGLKPPPSLLKGVEEPTTWTTEEIRAYIDRVLDVSDTTPHVFENDPQIVMLARLGEDNLDLLVEALGTHQSGDYHLIEAIARLVREEHQAYVLEQLPLHAKLVTIVYRHGWEEDARDILIDGLSSGPRHIPGDWIKAAARLDDPRIPDALVSMMVRGRQTVAIYHALEQFGGLDLDRIVHETWVENPSRDPVSRAVFARIAISHGIRDALVFVARTLIQGELPEYQRRALRTILKRSVDHRGTDREIALWVLENPDALQFDSVTRMFTDE